MHLPGDPREAEIGTVESRLDWYFEAATIGYEMAITARMKKDECTRAAAIVSLQEDWARLDQRKYEAIAEMSRQLRG